MGKSGHPGGLITRKSVVQIYSPLFIFTKNHAYLCSLLYIIPPKKDAEKIYDYVREKIQEAKEAPGKQQEAAEKPKSTDDLLAIVRERYARGEITREELMTMTKDLTGQ